MERLIVTPETQDAIDAYKLDRGGNFDPDGNIYTGSNLVVDDHLQIDSSWSGIVVGGEGGLVHFCIPDWGNLFLPIDLVDYVTDRAGPEGETMPIFDPVQVEARAASKTVAVAPDTTQQHGHHRTSLADALRNAIKRLPHDKQQHAREVLRKAGVLEKGHG